MSDFNPTVMAQNQTYLDGLTNKDPFVQKEAAKEIDNYLVLRATEDGIFRKVRPAIPVQMSDMDRSISTLRPIKIREMQPRVASAYSLPIGGVPSNSYIGAPRYEIVFDRVKSRRFTADVAELRGYQMDIRQVFNDLMLKEILAEEDRKFLAQADNILGAINDGTTERAIEVGAKGWITLGGAMSRATMSLLRKGMSSTNRNLTPQNILVNNVLVEDTVLFRADDVGPNLAEKLVMNGVAEIKGFFNMDWIVTIKKDLVPNDVAYLFAAPSVLGDFLVLEDVTVSTKVEDWRLEMFAWEYIGGSLANVGAFCKGSFTGESAGTWALA